MSDPRLEGLRALPMAIAVATALPDGFALLAVESDVDPEWGSSYRIRYAGPGEALVMVEGVTGGVGDPLPGRQEWGFLHPDLGSGTLEYYGPDSEEPVDFRSSWLPGEGAAYAVAGRRLPPEEAVRLAEGLRFLAGP